MSRTLAKSNDPRTVLLRMAADRARAERIHDAKAARPDLTWAAIAEAVGVRERSAAAWQATGSITHDNCVKLAEVFEVDPDYLWRGRQRPSSGTPDLIGSLNGQTGLQAQLDRIEEKLDEVLRRLGEDQADGKDRQKKPPPPAPRKPKPASG